VSGPREPCGESDRFQHGEEQVMGMKLIPAPAPFLPCRVKAREDNLPVRSHWL